MSNELLIKIKLLQIESLIADKNYEIAIANRELSNGDWLYDHNSAIRDISDKIDLIIEEINALSKDQL